MTEHYQDEIKHPDFRKALPQTLQELIVEDDTTDTSILLRYSHNPRILEPYSLQKNNLPPNYFLEMIDKKQPEDNAKSEGN